MAGNTSSVNGWSTAVKLPVLVPDNFGDDLEVITEECSEPFTELNYMQHERLLSAIHGEVASSAHESAVEPEKKAETLTEIQQLLKNASSVEHGKPSVYTLEGRTTYHDEATGIRHVEIVQPSLRFNKTVLLIGETGSGKSTLINAIANYALGVEWDDDYRVRLVQDAPRSQSESQTDSITAYTLNMRDSFPITVIDTPGFGDTRGPTRDARLVKMIEGLFESAGNHPVNHIDAICIVLASSQSRLTAVQKYILDSTLSLFSNEVGENIYLMLTFCDANRPQVLIALQDFQVSYPHFKFNNSALFYQKTGDENEEFNKLFWAMMQVSCRKFFEQVPKRTGKSLTLTKEVLRTRMHLECAVQGLHEKVSYGLTLMENIRQDQLVIEANESRINANRDFVVKRKIPKVKQVSIAGSGKYVTNCTLCNMTCHYPCAYTDDQKFLCWTVVVSDEFRNAKTVSQFRDGHRKNCLSGLSAEENERSIESAHCSVCPKKCSWKKHKNNDFIYEVTEVEECVTLEELKTKYHDAVKGLTNAEALKKGNHEKYMLVQNCVYQCLAEVRAYLDQLEKIALRPSALTTVDYINLMIVQEKTDCRAGYSQRIMALEAIIKRADTLKELKASENFNPLKELI